MACKQRVFNSVRAHVVFMQEPNAKEYLQLALARILELQREIKDGTYATDHTSDLGNVNLENYYTIVAASSLVFSGGLLAVIVNLPRFSEFRNFHRSNSRLSLRAASIFRYISYLQAYF